MKRNTKRKLKLNKSTLARIDGGGDGQAGTPHPFSTELLRWLLLQAVPAVPASHLPVHDRSELISAFA
jgi:hypothetical protein